MTEPLYIAKGTAEGSPPIYLHPRMANRHGLVAGATGTGKTVTLQTMAENFSRGGVPVFISDIKGDVSGISQPASEYQSEYGNVSPASVGAIQRGLLTLEEQGVVKFFGEPALNFADFLQTDANGKGIINVLASDKLAQSPKLYATMLLWLLAELFENLPEVGDLDEPKLVFFFDEAHLLFTDAPDALQDKIEQVVQLIRSKGVGVYFVTQNPLDVPDRVLGQLGNRVQHALRAFTPRDQKAVRTAAQTFRANPDLDIETVITELGVGEALVSFLDEKGTPGVTQRAYILPPRSLIGMITPEQRTEIIKSSLIAGVYEKEVDRESAYEMLQAKADKHVAAAEQLRQEKEAEAAAKKAEAEAKKSEAEQKNEKRSGHARPPNKRVNRNELPKRKPENKHKRSAKQNAPPRTIHSTNSSARWRLRPAEKSRAGSLEICLGRALPGANAKHSLL